MVIDLEEGEELDEASLQVLTNGHHPEPKTGDGQQGQTNGQTKIFESSLRDCVDQMERTLAIALKDYRQKAEDILEEHYDIIEHAQMHYDHTISLLRSENTQLRKMLGVKKPESSIAQNIMFQTSNGGDVNPIDRKAVAKAVRQGGDDDKQQGLATRNKRKGQQDPSLQAGGTWQQFMAWVPNGAALQQPEPWRPLPNQQQPGGQMHMPQISNSPQSGKKSDGPIRSQKSVHQMQAILPGSIDDDDSSCYKDEDEQSEATSSETTMLEKERLEVVDTWKPTHRELKKMADAQRTSLGDQSEFSKWNELDANEMVFTQNKPRWILDPDSSVRISWDLASLCMVVYDMIMIPMMSFDMPENAFFQTMDWTTRLFWTFDIGWSCCTGVVLNDGRVEYNAKHIWKRYAKSWLPLDLFIVGSDWFGLIFQSGGMGLSKLARASRVARVVRLLRLVRMQEIIANIMERIQNDKISFLLHVMKLMIFLVVACHVMACMWWAVGDREIAGETWVKTWVNETGHASADVGLCYLVSLHWSLAQFGGGMEEFSPSNGFERFFAIVTWVFAFMAGLIMISVLTSTMTQQYIIGGSGARQMATLKKYLNQNRVPKNLVKRVCRNAKHAISGDLTPDTVDLLHVVSEPLQVEMHFEMYSRTLANHPFFLELLEMGPHLMRRICHLAMSTLWLASGDVMFSKGEEPSEPKMIFVCSGVLSYTDDYGEKTPVNEKMWVSEGVLWTSWRHMGSLVATNDVKLALLDAMAFQDICGKFMKKAKTTSLCMKKYAKAFVDDLNALGNYTDLYQS